MLPRRLFDAIAERDGGFCLMALRDCMGEGTVLHHRANRGFGGSKILDHPANLILVCGQCNGDAEDAGEIIRYNLLTRGHRVEKAATNAATLMRAIQTPVEYLDGSRWLLTDEHTREPYVRAAVT